MLNKFKKAIKYIAKKIKQGVKIMAEISKDIITGVSEVGKEVVLGTKDVINTVGTTAVNRYADHADKKLDMIQAAAIGLKNTGSSLCNGVKSTRSSLCNCFNSANNRKVIGIIFTFVGMGLYASGCIRNDKEVK